MSDKPRVRFAPSPTGYLHIGGARTALYNWLHARHTGGTFILRIEDTDRERHVEGAVERIVQDLRWLGIDWDEGYGVGGPNGPYVQSQRLDIYRQYVAKLLSEGKAYYAFQTEAELDALREQAMQAKRSFRFPRPSNPVTDPAEAQRMRQLGKPAVVRFMVPGHDVAIGDLVFGHTVIAAAEQDDFIILKDDGYPTYHLANVVDDGLMGVTHVLRGQEFLGQTWRQTLLREALGFPEPQYAHLPLILNMAGQKLSKRDGAVAVDAFRAGGYMPEVVLNFIALCGWSGGGDREKYSKAELIEAFSLERLSKTNAKFDHRKLLAFNTEFVAQASEERLLEAFKDYLSLNQTPIPGNDDELLRRIVRACHGFRTFADIPVKVGVLFMADDAYPFDPKAVEKVLAKGGGEGFAVLAELTPMLAETAWEEQALKQAIEGIREELDLRLQTF